MIPKSLEISGFLSYKKTVTLDFESFDLACITGDNGAGKSSILDAITWSLFGRARKSDDSVINLQSVKASVTFIFQYEDALYKVRRINPRNSTKSLELYVKRGEDWLNLTERTMKQTDEKIQKIFGLDYETFVNVSFFLQGKADQFTQQSPGNRKAILSQILGLDMWEQYRIESSNRRRKCEEDLLSIEGVMNDITTNLVDEDELKADIHELEHELELLEGDTKVALSEYDKAKELHEGLKGRKNLLAERQSAIDRMLKSTEALRKKLDERVAEEEAGDKALEQKADTNEIFNKYTKCKDLVDVRNADRETYNNLLADIDELKLSIEDVDISISADRTIVRMNHEIELHTALMENETCPTCGTVLDTAQYKLELDALEGKRDITYDTMKKEYLTDANTKLKKAEEELEELGFDPDEYHEALNYVNKHRDIRVKYDLIVVTESRLEPIRREIKELKNQIQDSEDETEKAIELLEVESDDLADTIASLPDLEAHHKEFVESKDAEDVCRQEVGAAKQKLKALQASGKRLEALKVERADIAEAISLHKRLEVAFGKNGIPALLIEQSLPQIEERANAILGRLSGNTMSVRFLTQREYKDEKRTDKKETLDIQIQDFSGIRDYEMYSGGESFRINFAIRLALSYVLAQRAGAKIQTLVIDEGFGSQDSIGKERLIEAINEIREDFAKILIITHVDELKEIFPTQVFVQKTLAGSTISIL